MPGTDKDKEQRGAFRYRPYGGDYTTYGQPGGSPSHRFFQDASSGVSAAWDETMKANQ
jgi:hypothetical protein